MDGWHPGAEGVDHLDEGGLAGLVVGVVVGGDDALVATPGGLDLDVRVVSEHGGEPLLLALDEQLDPYLRMNARPGTTPWFATSRPSP